MSWELINFYDVVNSHDALRIPLSSKERTKKKGNYRYYGAQGVIDYIDEYIFDGEFILVAEDGENLRTKKEPLAQIASGKFWVNNHAHIYSAKTHLTSNKFICHVFNYVDVSHLITGAAQPKLSQGSLKLLKIPFPPKHIQDKIIGLISNYDDLIQINQQRIALLEEAAQRLYDEWFVKLRFPHHEQVPVVEGVPEGWERVRLKDIADINASSIKKNEFETINYIDISSVEERKIQSSITVLIEEAAGRAKRKVKHGDIIWSCVRPNRRQFSIIWKPISNLIISTGFSTLSAKDIPFTYLYFLSDSKVFSDYLENVATGSAYPAVTASDFENYETVKPNQKLIQAFDRIVLPLVEQAENLKLMNQKLTQARDELLPRLMSGQLDISKLT